MNKTLRSALLCAVAAACASTDALAATVRQSVGFNNVQVSLTDLRPDDGIAPSFTVKRYFTEYQHYMDDYATPKYDVYWTELVHGEVPSAYEHQYGQAITSGETSGTFGELSAFAQSSEANQIVSSGIRQVLEINLSPHTMLVFSGELYHTLELTDVGTVPYYGAFGQHVAVDTKDTHWTKIQGEVPGSPGETVTDRFWYAIANTEDTANWVKLTLGTSAHATALAVPEPSTWAMLLGGIGILAAVARRRQTGGAVTGTGRWTDTSPLPSGRADSATA
ncbi:PEPxxWA-CTERM sorting domain-containing protein [Massilia sp. METH4]|uniref:PEPxxWA-CTERM sorting domain-containing protein n=1 Tax=Massilia sp. METH4 TaxID=3123041 RepID=UPI0030D067E5